MRPWTINQEHLSATGQQLGILKSQLISHFIISLYQPQSPKSTQTSKKYLHTSIIYMRASLTPPFLSHIKFLLARSSNAYRLVCTLAGPALSSSIHTKIPTHIRAYHHTYYCNELCIVKMRRNQSLLNKQ